MNENEVTPESRRKEFIADVPEFACTLSHSNPFIPETSINLRQDGQTLSWDWRYRTPSKPIAPLWGEVAESLLSRTLRDAKRFPGSARALANAGAAFLGQGALEEAAQQFVAALHHEPHDPASLGGLARVRMLQGDLEAAKDLYERLHLVNSDDASASLGLAHVAVSKGELKDAVDLFERATQCDTGTSLAEYHLALLLLRLSRNSEAIAHLRSALRHEVRWPTMHEALGLAYVLNGSLRKAEKEFKTALRLIPDNERAAHGLAEVLDRLGENDGAIGFLNNFLTRKPQDAKARELIARAYEKASAYRRAREQLLEAEPLIDENHSDQRVRILNNIGVCSSLMDQAHSAGQWFAKSIDSEPTSSAIPYLNSARLDMELLRYESAISILRLCQLRFPNIQAQLVPLLAECLVRTDREIEAAQELRKLVEKGAATSLAYAMLGGIIVEPQIRDINGAISVLEEGYTKYPRDPRIGNNLAYVYLQAHLPGRARSILEDVGEFQEMDVPLIATWGLLNLWEGNLIEGEEKYKQAEALARRRGQTQLAEQVRQKMHLEIARYYFRRKEYAPILPEVRKGLLLKGRKSFRADLERLLAEVGRVSLG
jgi:tetratricopeptide (TPR) repeat protein